MTKKKAFITLLAVIFLISVITPTAWAGRGGNRPGNRPNVISKYKQHRPYKQYSNRYGKWQRPRPYQRHRRPSHRARVYVQSDLGLLLGGLIIGGIIVHGLSQLDNQNVQNPDNDAYWEDDDVKWQTERVWVEPLYRKVWVRGHTNRQGNWVSAHWKKKLVNEGYWKTVRVSYSENK